MSECKTGTGVESKADEVQIEGMLRVGVMAYTEAKRLQAQLEEAKIGCGLRSDPSTCTTGGCSPTVELWVRADQVEELKQFFSDERSRAHAGLEFDPSLFDEVFDPEKGEAKCPACGTAFSTTLRECPDCGLGFGPMG